MSDVLRRLAIELGIDTAVFEEGLHETVHMFSEAMSEITKSAVISGDLIAEGIREGAEALKELAEEAMKHGAEIAEDAEKYGMTAEALSVLSVAAALSGTSLEESANAMKHMNDNMSKAAGGSAQANEAFKVLGINVKDANGHIKNSNDVLSEISEKFQAAEDDANKTAIAVAIFGKAGADMIPMLNKGKEGFDEATQAAKDCGLILSGPAAEAAKKTEEHMQLIHLAAQGQAQQFTTGLMPSLLKVTDAFMGTGHGMDVMSGAGEALGYTLKLLMVPIIVIKDTLALVSIGITHLGMAMMDIARGQWKDAWEVMSDDEDVHNVADDLRGITKLFEDAGGASEEAANKMDEAGKKSKDSLGAMSGKEHKEKKEKELPDFFTQDKEMRRRSEEEYRRWTEEQARADKAMENLRQRLMNKRQLEDADLAKELEEVKHAVEIKNLTEQEGYTLSEQLREKHNDKLAQMDEDLLRKKLDNINCEIDYVKNGLDTIGKQHSGAAKLAADVSKAQALFKIGVDTRSAAMAAYNAMVGIPVVGPELAVAAAGAAIAFGAAQAAAVTSGGSSSAGSSVAAVSAGSITPSVTVQNQQSGGAPRTTILHFPENAIMTGRQIMQFLSEALADNGGKLGNLQVIGA